MAGVVAVLMLATAGAAFAHGPHGGTFTGYEVPPATVNFTNPATLCGEFVATSSDPLKHYLDMSGDFEDATGTGTAEFTRTTTYYANPEGTYSDSNCLNMASVSGSMTIDFEQYECSGTGIYERRLEEVYTLDFDGTCDDTTTGTVETVSTTASFTGDQVICPSTGCPGYPSNAGTSMSGSYVQDH